MNAPATHWLYRPRTRRWLVGAGIVLLVLSVLAEWFVHLHPAFAFDAWFGFNAVYGFLACVAMVVFAKVLGWLVKRPDDYYAPHGRGGSGEGRDASGGADRGLRRSHSDHGGRGGAPWA